MQIDVMHQMVRSIVACLEQLPEEAGHYDDYRVGCSPSRVAMPTLAKILQ